MCDVQLTPTRCNARRIGPLVLNIEHTMTDSNIIIDLEAPLLDPIPVIDFSAPQLTPLSAHLNATSGRIALGDYLSRVHAGMARK